MKFTEEDYFKLNQIFSGGDISACTLNELERFMLMLSRPNAFIHFGAASFPQICDTVRTLISVRKREDRNLSGQPERHEKMSRSNSMGPMNAKFDISVNWYIEFLQRLREFRTHCADALRTIDISKSGKVNVLPIQRAVDALERHWRKRFPQHTLPHRDDINKHLRFGLPTDVLDLMTKDIHDAEVKALSVIDGEKVPNREPFVSPDRIEELRLVSTQAAFDLSRLLRLCEELNIVSRNECHIATAVLVRALIDHIPPVFGQREFNEVANNYAGTKSFVATAKHLQESLRKIADALLHSPIRRTESLPTATQVDFKQSLDVILGEVARILKNSAL